MKVRLSLEYTVSSMKLKEDIKTSFGDSSFVPDPLGVDFYSGFHKEKDELIPEDILDVMAIREVLNIGLNKAIESQEILERQAEEEFEKTVRLENPELNEFQLTDALNAWAESEGHGKLTQRQLARAFGAYAEAYDPFIQSLVDQNNAIRNNTYLNRQWPMDTISQYEQTGSMPDVPKYKDFFYKEDPLTTAVKSIEDEKEAESDTVTQAQEIENQKTLISEQEKLLEQIPEIQEELRNQKGTNSSLKNQVNSLEDQLIKKSQDYQASSLKLQAAVSERDSLMKTTSEASSNRISAEASLEQVENKNKELESLSY